MKTSEEIVKKLEDDIRALVFYCEFKVKDSTERENISSVVNYNRELIEWITGTDL